MAKKDKYNWSKYQLDIFDFIKHGQGNCVIQAAAGSGKTTVLIKSLDFIDKDKSVLLTAFNRDIVSVLEKKSKGFPNVTAMTLHSLGLKVLKRNYPSSVLKINEFKYASYINKNISWLSDGDVSKRGVYMSNINNYVNFGRFYMCQTEEDLSFIEERYGINTVSDEKSVAIKVMEWGKKNLDEIDYTDMIWIPNVMYLDTKGLKYDWIFSDECQDYNVAERELLLKCRKINTRMVSCGDKSQCIYAFSGSDPYSFKALQEVPNTISLPLSITYRCADKIVEYASKYTDKIEKNGQNREGRVIYGVNPLDVPDDSMVLCRTNAPLIKLYTKYLLCGRKAYIRGKDIGENLIELVKRTGKDELNLGLASDGVFVRLYEKLFDMRDDIMLKNNINKHEAMDSAQFQLKFDMIKSLEILSGDIFTSRELIAKIESIFSDKKNENGTIWLSTVHKSKGLEADNVFVLCDSLMKDKKPDKEWEITQEKNLMYVAYTRAKNTLGFLDEHGFEDVKYTYQAVFSDLKKREDKVNMVLGKKPKDFVIDSSNAYDVIKNAKPIEKTVGKSKEISFGQQSKRSNNTLYNKNLTKKYKKSW